MVEKFDREIIDDLEKATSIIAATISMIQILSKDGKDKEAYDGVMKDIEKAVKAKVKSAKKITCLFKKELIGKKKPHLN